jgi:hypothetical protein
MKRHLFLAAVLVNLLCLSGAMTAILPSSDASASDSGLFIAVGQGGVIVTSPDGVNWVRRPHDFGHPNFEDISHVNGTFFVMGGKRGMARTGILLTSRDAIHWAEENIGRGNQYVLTDMAYGKGTYAIVGNRRYSEIAYSDGIVLTSKDGHTWRDMPFEKNEITSIAFGNNVFVAMTDYLGKPGLLVSGDGVIWSKNPAPGKHGNWGKILFAEGQFVTASSYKNRVFTSPNGIEWKEHTIADPTGKSFYMENKNIAYGDGKFIIVAKEGIVVSDDAKIWEKKTLGEIPELRDVAFGKGKYVAVAYDNYHPHGMILTSTDGETWEGNIDYPDYLLNKVIYVDMPLSKTLSATKPRKEEKRKKQKKQ